MNVDILKCSLFRPRYLFCDDKSGRKGSQIEVEKDFIGQIQTDKGGLPLVLGR